MLILLALSKFFKVTFDKSLRFYDELVIICKSVFVTVQLALKVIKMHISHRFTD